VGVVEGACLFCYDHFAQLMAKYVQEAEVIHAKKESVLASLRFSTMRARGDANHQNHDSTSTSMAYCAGPK